MKRSQSQCLTFVCFFLIVFSSGNALADPGTLFRHQNDPLLQSAFLRRPADAAKPLTVHFSRVLELLRLYREESLDLATRRLERSEGAFWTQDLFERNRAMLAVRRELQLERLRSYRDRRRFPINDSAHRHCVPVFVDRNNTACAVGYLMRCSKAHTDVGKIVRENNGVYVMYAVRGPLVEWILTSGLTQEEAALIQPGYPFAPHSMSVPEALLAEGQDWPNRRDADLWLKLDEFSQTVGW